MLRSAPLRTRHRAATAIGTGTGSGSRRARSRRPPPGAAAAAAAPPPRPRPPSGSWPRSSTDCRRLHTGGAAGQVRGCGSAGTGCGGARRGERVDRGRCGGAGRARGRPLLAGGMRRGMLGWGTAGWVGGHSCPVRRVALRRAQPCPVGVTRSKLGPRRGRASVAEGWAGICGVDKTARQRGWKGMWQCQLGGSRGWPGTGSHCSIHLPLGWSLTSSWC